MSISKAFFLIYKPSNSPLKGSKKRVENGNASNKLDVQLRGEDLYENVSSNGKKGHLPENAKWTCKSPLDLEVELEVFPESIDPNTPHLKEMDELMLFLQCAQKKSYQYFGMLMGCNDGGNTSATSTKVEKDEWKAETNSVVRGDGDDIVSEVGTGEYQDMSSLDSSS